MSFFLALDVGGTKTDYVLADETRVLARVRSGTIKRMRVDAATAMASLEGALQELTARTGISMQSIASTCVGTAGNTVPLVTDFLRDAITGRVAGRFTLVGDVEIALDAAFHGGPGILVLAGTGSNVAGRTHDGRLLGAGGWGPALADQGSGNRIGQEALRAAYLAKDEGRATTLFEAVTLFWGLASEDGLIEYANSQPSPDFSKLTEVVLRCANAGDGVAAAVLRREGEDLGYLVRLMHRRLRAALQSDEATQQGSPISVAFAGSIMENVTPVRLALVQAVRTEFPDIVERDGVIDPIMGAVWKARRVV